MASAVAEERSKRMLLSLSLSRKRVGREKKKAIANRADR